MNFELLSKGKGLSGLAWLKFRKNKLALISLFFIILIVVIAIAGYLIIPDSTPYSNRQTLELTTKKPGFKVKMLLLDKKIKPQQRNLLSKMLMGEPDAHKFVPIESYEHIDGKIIVKTYDKKIIELPQGFDKDHIITKHFLLGTDRFGRDVLSQLIIGTRVSLAVGLIAVLISLLIGISLGAIGGYFGGWIDDFIVWLINVVWSIPSLLLVIAITFALGKGFWQVFIAVGLTMWVEVARVVRGQVISIREKEYVEAARALGFGNSRIIIRHVLPGVIGSVIVISAANFASAILIEAGLSFLGLGVQPPVPSWGAMIKENYPYIILDYAYLAILPGVAIMLTVLSFMLIGNGLRDALDVKNDLVV